MKAYSPASIKKRGDGREIDPYLSRLEPEDRAVCLTCHAVYHNKHWSLTLRKPSNGHSRKVFEGVAKNVVCPACQKIKDHFPMGIITLKGNYVKRHRQEILNLVHNEETRARGFNPLERLVSIRDEQDSLIIETTTEKLAQRIGSRLQHAHKGEVLYKWSHRNRFIRVAWERNLESER